MKRKFYSSLLVFMLIGCGDLTELVETTGTESNTSLVENTSTSEKIAIPDEVALLPNENNLSIIENILPMSKEDLGKAFFSDANLSFDRTLSCASCHDLAYATIDIRENNTHSAVSVGDDNIVLGDRNSQMIEYMAFSPEFIQDENGSLGGTFWDGRSANLKEQAKGPFLNEVEMQMPSISSVVERIKENNLYISQLERLYGEDIFKDDDAVFDALADAISLFESADSFASFDSKMDKVRARSESFTEEEQLGQDLFRENGCVSCHDDRGFNPLFTTFRYENIGVPKNTLVRELNGLGEDFIDHGLLDNPLIDDPRENGKFKIPSLRNVAITAPYMHNGKFKDLKTVVHFYNTRDVEGAINPETSLEWEESEVARGRVRSPRVGDLELSDSEEDAIVAFLKTLTDERYETLIP